MSLDKEDLILIEKYLEGSISPHEMELFNTKIQNKDFKDELELHQNIAKSLTRVHEKKLKAELKVDLGRIYKANTTSKPFKIRPIFYYWAATLSAILISAFIYFNVKNSARDLFRTYYKPYPVAPMARGELGPMQPSAFERYNNGDFENAVPLFRQLIKEQKNPEDKTLFQLLLGNCLLNINQPNEAIENFDMIIRLGDTVFVQHAQWYKSLALLQMEKKDELQKILEQMKNDDSIYAQRAAGLLNDVNDL